MRWRSRAGQAPTRSFCAWKPIAASHAARSDGCPRRTGSGRTRGSVRLGDRQLMVADLYEEFDVRHRPQEVTSAGSAPAAGGRHAACIRRTRDFASRGIASTSRLPPPDFSCRLILAERPDDAARWASTSSRSTVWISAVGTPTASATERYRSAHVARSRPRRGTVDWRLRARSRPATSRRRGCRRRHPLLRRSSSSAASARAFALLYSHGWSTSGGVASSVRAPGLNPSVTPVLSTRRGGHRLDRLPGS